MRLGWLSGSMVVGFMAGGVLVHCGTTDFASGGDAGTDGSVKSSGTGTGSSSGSGTASGSGSGSAFACFGSMECASLKRGITCCGFYTPNSAPSSECVGGSTCSAVDGGLAVELCGAGLVGDKPGTCTDVSQTCTAWACAGGKPFFACSNPDNAICKAVVDAGIGSGSGAKMDAGHDSGHDSGGDACVPKQCKTNSCGELKTGCGGVVLNCGETCAPGDVCDPMTSMCCAPSTICPAGECGTGLSDNCGGKTGSCLCTLPETCSVTASGTLGMCSSIGLPDGGSTAGH